MINPIAQMEAFKAAQEKAEIVAAEAEARNLLIRPLVDIGTPSMKAKRRADISLMWAFRKHLRKPLRNPKAPAKQAFPSAKEYAKAAAIGAKKARELSNRIENELINKPTQKPRNAA